MAEELSCDSDGVCGMCHILPPDTDVLQCDSCTFMWHMKCLQPPLEHVPVGDWECPDCNPRSGAEVKPVAEGSGLVKKIMEIESDPNLSEDEKKRLRQELMAGKMEAAQDSDLEEKYKCAACLKQLDRPVSTSCQHNFCLHCLESWFRRGNKTCISCRTPMNEKFIQDPRINFVLAAAIRSARLATRRPNPSSSSNPANFVANEDRPDTCYVTDRAKKTGKANAASGKIFVTGHRHRFGPIPPEEDPRGQGVLVGESWGDRLECRQWGTHRPHVSGIYGRGALGSQSVALSGGYIDDEDHGDWFLYTGSGGRDLSGNKRTNSSQSHDQVFTKQNKALVTSCLKGYPVRVVRSHKEKRSTYAPESGVRYDGVYRVEKCWRKVGVQKFLVCRYLFVRCDNEAAPWSSDEVGDKPRELPDVGELEEAQDLQVRSKSPAWDWNEETGQWCWMLEHPYLAPETEKGSRPKRSSQSWTKELNKYKCGHCRKPMEQPVTTPCAHNFCMGCLVKLFEGQSANRDRGGRGRSLRVQKNIKRCRKCSGDITQFMEKPSVNRDLEEIIQNLRAMVQESLEAEALKAKSEVAEEEEESEDSEDEEGLEEEGEDEKVDEGAHSGSREVAAAVVGGGEEGDSEEVEMVVEAKKNGGKKAEKEAEKKRGRKRKVEEVAEVIEEEKQVEAVVAVTKAKRGRKKGKVEAEIVNDQVMEEVAVKPKPKARAGRKRGSGVEKRSRGKKIAAVASQQDEAPIVLDDDE